MNFNETFIHLKSLLRNQDDTFWGKIRIATTKCQSLSELLQLTGLCRQANKLFKTPTSAKLRIAIIGGYTFNPFADVLLFLLEMANKPCELFIGEFDNHVAEIVKTGSPLQHFKPDVILFFPPARRCFSSQPLATSHKKVSVEAAAFANQILALCHTANQINNTEVLLANHPLPTYLELGPLESKMAASMWNYRKLVNLYLGIEAKPYITLLNIEYLSCYCGLGASEDKRSWYESKQMGSSRLIYHIVCEAAHIIKKCHQPPKKVLVLDLDNTLWGGVIGDDGLENIELGDTSPKGEAFKSFQKAIKKLKERGILLAICSKNNEDTAKKPFLEHPEMVLKLEDFVVFKANWKPKSDNIIDISKELNLGIDSLTFVDDNPAEIDIVNQFVPEVETLQLSKDPSDYVNQLLSTRWFDTFQLSQEDEQRTLQYQQEAQRQNIQLSYSDMDTYLKSIDMKGCIRPFTALDVSRITQLINKSNQFNVTTRRRNQAEVEALLDNKSYYGFTTRLQDRFGDSGLISIVILQTTSSHKLLIDTFLMSCRVLERKVEYEVLNHIINVAKNLGIKTVEGKYLPTAKNKLVKDLYPRLGFNQIDSDKKQNIYQLAVNSYQEHTTSIQIIERTF